MLYHWTFGPLLRLAQVSPVNFHSQVDALPMLRSCFTISSIYFWNSWVATPRLRSFFGRNDRDIAFFGSMAKIRMLRKHRERASR